MGKLAAAVAEGDVELVGRAMSVVRGRGAAGGDAVFEHAPLAIQEIDWDGRLLRVNPAFCRMTGYQPEELLGRPVTAVAASPDCLERFRDLLYAGEGVADFEMAYMRIDGALLPGRVTAGVIPGDELCAPTVLAVFAEAVDGSQGDAAPAVPEARTDAVEILAGAVAGARDAAEARGIGIGFTYSADPVWLDVEEDELRIALDQLIATAVDSAADGSVAVRCTPEAGEARLEVLVTGEAAAAAAGRTTFSDDGDGIVALHTLVRTCNGDIGMAAAPGGGNRLTVRLPLRG